jgi:thymidylate kinase
MTIVLCGPDGSGKSTAMEKVIAALAPSFSPAKGRQFHWKPPVFSGKRQAARAPVTDPHAAPPRNSVASVVAFGVHWLEFWLGTWLTLRPVTFKGGLVLIDRWYYDFLVDQKRYRLRVPTGLVRAGYRLLPKPDLVLLLDAPAEILLQRKQELALEEIERQRTAYLAALKPLPNCVVLDASEPPDCVAANIRNAILDLAARRVRRR